MKLKNAEIQSWLEQAPPERADTLLHLFTVIRRNMPAGFAEVVSGNLLSWVVPLEVCPQTYNGQALMYAGLAAQKQYCSVYLMSIYLSDNSREQFQRAWRDYGGRVDMGKSCLHIRKLADAPLDLIAEAVAAYEPAEFAARVQAIQSVHRTERTGRANK